MADEGNSGLGGAVSKQDHSELIKSTEEQWWWAVYICLSAIAVVANLIFVVTVNQ